MEEKSPSESIPYFKAIYALAQVFGLLLVSFVIFWIITYLGGFGWTDPAIRFNWHPVLMTIGAVYLFANSILAYRGFRQSKKINLKIAHAFGHTISFVLIIIALIAVFDSHNLAKPNPIPNMYSLHSWIGLGTVLLFSMEFVLGFGTFLFPGAVKPVRERLLPYHKFFGILIFVFYIASFLLGLYEKTFFHLGKTYSSLPSEGFVVNIIGVIALIFGSLVVYLVTTLQFKRVQSPEETLLLN